MESLNKTHLKNEEFALLVDPTHATQPEEFDSNVATPEVDAYVAPPEVVVQQFVQSPAVPAVALLLLHLLLSHLI